MKSASRIVICLAALLLLAGAAVAADTERLRPEPLVKGQPDPPGTPSHDGRAAGGPDAFGYTFIDSNEPGGPTPSFFDISGTGTPVALGDDAETGLLPLGFSFPFYGTDETSVNATSNGLITFATGVGGEFTNDCPFDPMTTPTRRIAAYWDDMDPGDDGALLYHQSFGACPVGSGACFIVQWEEFDYFPGDGAPGGTAGTFQFILYESGDMLLQTETLTDNNSATLGISNDAMGESLLVGCNTPLVGNNYAVEYGLGDVGDLSIDKSGHVGVGGPSSYDLVVENLGPFDQTNVSVEDILPGNVSYVSNTCGGSEVGGVFTWDIGNLANGASASCQLEVELNSGICEAVDNTATVQGDLADPPGNNSSTTTNGGGNLVADPGFETGTPNAAWTEASTNFGSPVCDVGSCGTGTGTGPRTGTFWTWFGGIAAFEEGSMSQTLTIPTGANTLSFWIEAIVCNSPVDFMEVLIDGNQVYLIDGSSPLCGSLGYTQQTVDISAYADGGNHTLEFHSITSSGGVTNFFVDDVEIDSAPTCIEVGIPILEIPTVGQWGLLAFALLLACGAVWRMRLS